MSVATNYFQRVAALLTAMQASDATGQPLALDETCDKVARHILKTGRGGRKIVLVGNGGSAAIAGHMEMDLCNRVGVRATVFNDPPVLTALANDYGYETAFERLVGLWIEPGDCLIAISSSGRSPNITRHVQAGRAGGATVVTFSGFAANNPLRALGDHNFYVASSEYGEVEVAHHALGHFLTDRAAQIASSNEE